MLGQNILNYAHPSDRPYVQQALIPDNLDTLFDTNSRSSRNSHQHHHHNRRHSRHHRHTSDNGSNGSNGNGTDSHGATGSYMDDGSVDDQDDCDDAIVDSRVDAIEQQLQADRRRFTFRLVSRFGAIQIGGLLGRRRVATTATYHPHTFTTMRLFRTVCARRFARAGPRSEPTVYEIVRLEGCFRSADSSARAGAHDSTYPAGLQLTRRARTRDDSLPTHINGNDIVRNCAGAGATCTVATMRALPHPNCDCDN